MLTGKRLTALAIARAMQSGKPTVRAIVARIADYVAAGVSKFPRNVSTRPLHNTEI